MKVCERPSFHQRKMVKTIDLAVAATIRWTCNKKETSIPFTFPTPSPELSSGNMH